EVAAYAARARPLIEAAVAARRDWIACLADLDRGGALGGVGRVARGCASELATATHRLAELVAPRGYESVQVALAGWLGALYTSCEGVAGGSRPRFEDVEVARARLAE